MFLPCLVSSTKDGCVSSFEMVHSTLSVLCAAVTCNRTTRQTRKCLTAHNATGQLVPASSAHTSLLYVHTYDRKQASKRGQPHPMQYSNRQQTGGLTVRETRLHLPHQPPRESTSCAPPLCCRCCLPAVLCGLLHVRSADHTAAVTPPYSTEHRISGGRPSHAITCKALGCLSSR